MKKRYGLLLCMIIIAVICSFFAIHTLAANNLDTHNTTHFLTEKHVGIGCKIDYKDGKMILNADSASAHVETVKLDFGKFDGANSVKVVFDAQNKCSGVRLFVLKGDGEYSEESYSHTKNSTETPTVCYLPIRSDDVSDIRLVFEDLETDKVEIQSITPYSISIPDSSYPGQIDTCAINVSSNEVLVIGKIKNSELDSFSGSELHLFEQYLNEDTTPDTLAQSKSTLKTTVSSGEFIFRIKCNKKEELNAYLYKKYTVAIKQDDSYVMLDSPKCITNPDALSKQTTAPTQTSGKGQYGASLSFMQENMISDTAFSVDIGKFFSHLTSTGTKYECGGNVFYYNSDYVEQLDSVLLPYARKGINVTLIITLSNTGYDSLNKILIHPDSNLEAASFAFNTESRTSLSYLRAFCEFLAQRYCIDNPCVTRAVFGKEVANACKSYNMGEKNLCEFTEGYATAFLTVNQAFRSISKSIGIYTHIDNNWDTELSFDHLSRFDNKAFLTSLNNRIGDYGNFDWGVVIDPYPEENANYLAYADKTLSNTPDTDSVTLANLEVLSSFLNNQELLYDNAQRSLVIIEKSLFDGLDDKTIAADYVYGYYKAKNLTADAYITDRKISFGSVMKYIDTSVSSEKTSFALDTLNIKMWNEVIEGFNINSVTYKNYTHSEFESLPENITGRIDISNFSNDTAGWTQYNAGEELSFGKEMSGRTELLSVKLGNIPFGESRGISKKFTTPLDMSLIPILHFDVNIASLPPNVDRARLTLKFASGNEIIEFSGSIDKAVWTEIYCDLSDFHGLNNITSVTITLSGENGETFDDPQIFISTIEGISLEHDNEYLKNHFMAEKEDSLFQNIVDEYAIPFLVAIICICALILSYRLHRTKDEE
ncbi:MAG: hypothetical protein IKL40_01090 [Clostridia bacterium]|nr:hypothetical protein [Clostridia bacterium]